MSRTPVAALLALSLLGACAAVPTRPAAPDLAMPASLQQGITDPARSAILFTDSVFDRPAATHGRPEVAAQAVGQLEWLTVALPADQRFIGLQGNVAPQLRAGRDEVRTALGIAPEVGTNQVIAAMDAASAALRAGDRGSAQRALAGVTGQGSAEGGAEAALATLAALPRLPLASVATSAAQAGLSRMDRDSRSR
jgi:hypothetical protein